MQSRLPSIRRCTVAASVLASLLSWTGALGQGIRLIPVRSAPLGSPAGTIGDPVAPEFRLDLACWEYRVPAGGFELDLELQAIGWGTAAGSPTLGAIRGTVLPESYANGLGGELNPKGWPSSPRDGAYLPRNRCEAGGDLSPCTLPFDPTCDNGNNGQCVLASDWIMPDCANDLPAVGTATLAYIWATAASVDCNIDDGSIKTFGGLIVEVPIDAGGTYVIALDPDPTKSSMWTGWGVPFPYVNFVSTCITIVPGSCCSNIGPGTTVCETISLQQCELRPSPKVWRGDVTCEDCPCVDDCTFHSGDPDFCDDSNPCTEDSCSLECGSCIHSPGYNEATECCDPSNGNITPLEDGDPCTVGTCNPANGEVTQAPNPDCTIHGPDAFSKNRYLSFETGLVPADRAFHVRMTASWHFSSSVGDVGWVGDPDSEGTALVVPDPVFLASWPATVRVGDCEIAPGSFYEIRATGDGVNFDPPIAVQTTPAPGSKYWGDIVGDFNGLGWEPPNGVQNFSDVQAAILTFQAGASAAPLTWADVEPELPNRIVNINDVFALILAFQGEPYPFADPTNCPP